MILSSHVVIAAAAVAPFLTDPLTVPKAAAVLGVAILSHYAADMMPHWDYTLYSIVAKDDRGEAGSREFLPRRSLFLKDLVRAAADGLLGMAVAFWMLGWSFSWHNLALLLGVSLAAVLPDLAAVLYLIFPSAPFSWFYKAHIVHTKYRWKRHWFWGALLQVVSVTVIVFALRAIFRFW